MKVVPAHLRDAILDGRCIAFVGAGFAAPVVPTWPRLLSMLATTLGMDGLIPAEQISGQEKASALELEAYGQLLQDAAVAQRKDWKQLVRTALAEFERAQDVSGLERRREWLLGIPFKAILTTNFDLSLMESWWLRELEGKEASYWSILRTDSQAGWQLPDSDLNSEWRTPPVIKLHGDVEGGGGLVFSRRDYREKLYGNAKYTSFIRAAFASYTVLFLGVSFTDAYLNELRSETLKLLDGRGRPDVPWAYAIQLGARTPLVDFFGKHESIHTLHADTPQDWDQWLELICRETSVRGRLAKILDGKKIVWVDENPQNNAFGIKMFEACSGRKIETLASAAELRDDHADAHLLITQFGHKDGRALAVLDRVNQWKDRPPVIVFAAPLPDDQLRANRAVALRHGAFEYATDWSELYGLVESLFGRRLGRSHRHA